MSSVDRDNGKLFQASPLRHDLHSVQAGVWAARAAKLLGDSDLAPIYPWPVIAQRLERLASRTRNAHAAFFRHGETKYNARRLLSGQHNTVLTDIGRKQASEICHQLPGHIERIACSALSRAIETMELAIPPSRRTKAHTVVDPRLNEINLGEFQGRQISAIELSGKMRIDYSPKYGESYRAAAARIFSFVVDLFDAIDVSGRDPLLAVVFCHSGVLRIVSTLIRPVSTPDEIFKWKFGNVNRLDLRVNELRLPPFWERTDACID